MNKKNLNKTKTKRYKERERTNKKELLLEKQKKMLFTEKRKLGEEFMVQNTVFFVLFVKTGVG